MTRHLRLSWAAAAAAAVLTSAPALAQLDQTIQTASRATAAAAASQERIDQLDEERGDIFREYRKVLQEIDTQKLFVEQQKIFLTSQENELADLRRQIGEVENILRDLRPMQLEMIANLEEFVRLDLPFLRDERTDRLERLRELMDQPPTTVPPAEKYRKIIEAYQIESEYGRFLRTYDGPLWTDLNSAPAPDAPTVDYLLIGRVAFLYLTQDDSDLGMWDSAAGAWRSLPGSYKRDVRQAIRMAREVATPNVFMGPIPGPAKTN
ncbi:MAG: DUF3450 domain-containing protein [Caulobacterales bacterium]|nr:DUF3450 domain-containing protein [Caulobacterales bacterium]